MARFNTQPITGSVTAGGTLAALTQNAFIQLTGTAPYTLILPSPVLYPGFNQTFYNATSGTVTLTTPANVFTGAGGSGTATVTVPTTSTINLVSDGVNYVVVGEDGTSLTATTGLFSGNVTINGAGATLSVTPQTVTINPGGSSTIDNINIGATTRGSGAFNTLAANAAVTFTAGTASSTTGSGSLVVSGGIGVSGNINSGGTVAAVALSGPLTGTIQTAAQPNITSVGTLTGLTVKASSIGTLNLGEAGGGVGYVAASIIGTASTLYDPVGKLSFRLPTHGANTDYGLTEQMFIEGTGADSRGAYKIVMLPYGGNVGINVTNPTVKLDIKNSSATVYNPSTVAFNTILQLSNSTSGASTNALMSFVTESNGEWYTGAVENSGNTASDFVWASRASGARAERMRILSDGNVGIGATDPLAKLDIRGNTDSYAGMSKIYLTDLSTNASSRNWSLGNGGSAYGNLTFAVSAAKSGNAGDITAVNVMVMQPNGNVGIGTISPAYRLETVAGDSGTGQMALANFRTGSSVAGYNAGLQIYATGSPTATNRAVNVVWDADGANSAGVDYFYINKLGNSGQVDLVQQSVAAMTFQTSGIERLVINSGGDIVFGGGQGGVNRQFTINGSINKASRIIFQESGVDRWLVGHGAASENGNFEIYSANGNNFVFTRAGNFTAAGTVTANSDITLKTNVNTITHALDKVLALRGVMFDRISTGNHEMGVIAQEVELVVPELVLTDENGIKSVAYGNTVALLIEAVKEQQLQIEQLKKRLV